jgi:hypothetical protein
MAAMSGRKALKELDSFLAKARKVLAAVDYQYGGARDALARLETRRVRVYAELARLRLLAIEQGDLPQALDVAEREARAILDERDAAMKALEETIRSAESDLADEESRRARQQETVDAAVETLDAAEAAAQQALDADEAYRAQLERTEQADLIADRAEDKADAALKNRLIKGKPYEADPLFSYLWSHGYGTSRYRAFPLTRWLDRKVAQLCGYETARRDYALLNEIPKRLSEHAEAMRASFDREAGSLADLEEAAAARAGVPALDSELVESERELGAIDAAIEEREAAIRKLIEERRAFASGADDFYRRCIDVLSQSMQRDSMRLLRDRASRTLDPQDDALVRELDEVRRESRRIEEDLSEFSRLHEREHERVGQLEDVRRRFKAERFDDTLSEFKDWALIALILNQFLGGGARSSDVWKAIKRQQRRKPRQASPDFGSLRFPRAPRHGPWRMPRGGGFGGGGFKTGGGFRGGGFKTGGGF